jgi:hypothetical protein
MGKGERIEAFIDGLGVGASGLPPAYEGYFLCFNRGEYYEAHDVLEHLWLRDPGGNYAFYKGLIQLAGAFVHMKHRYFFPDHAVHGKRLAPATRLLALARDNLTGYGERHMGLDILSVVALIDDMSGALRAGQFQVNPWYPERAPRLELNQTPSSRRSPQ